MEAKKRPVGRPTKYTEEMPRLLEEYFDVPLVQVVEEQVATNAGVKTIERTKGADFPTFEGFCWDIGIHTDTFYEWVKRYPEFSGAYKKAQNRQKQVLAHNSMHGHYNNTFAIFFAKCNLGMNDKAAETAQDINLNLNYKKSKEDK